MQNFTLANEKEETEVVLALTHTSACRKVFGPTPGHHWAVVPDNEIDSYKEYDLPILVSVESEKGVIKTCALMDHG